MRIKVQLIDASTGNNEWAETYDRTLDNIFAIQSEIAQKVAGRLQAAISPEEIAQIEHLPTKSQEAYDCYVKYRQIFQADEFGRRDEIIPLLEKAVELDPEYHEAWAKLSIWYTIQWNVTKKRNDPSYLNKAHHALAEAKRLSPRSAHTLQAEAGYNQWELRNLETAIRLLLDILEIDPSYYSANRMLATTYWRLGRLDETQHQLEVAMLYDPLSQYMHRRLYQHYQLRRYWDKARNMVDKNLDRTASKDFWRQKLVELNYLQYGNKQTFVSEMAALPLSQENPEGKLAYALFSRNYQNALSSLEEMDSDSSVGFFNVNDETFSIESKDLLSALIWFAEGNLEQSRREAEKALNYWQALVEGALDPSPESLGQLIICQSLLGQREAMESNIMKARQLTTEPYWKYSDQAKLEVIIAICYLVLGEHDKAIEALETASKMDGPIFLNRELDLWFIFDRLRGNPRFDALLED